MERHPASQEYGCADGRDDEHIHVFSQEEEGEFDPGIFGVETGR
jgi:hypothetical protein